MQRLCKEEQKDLRYFLGSSCDKFQVMAAIPNRYSRVEGITETSLGAIEYISFTAYPEAGQLRNRESFSDALLQAVLRSKNLVNEINKHFPKPKEWPRIDSCLSKGKTHFYRACVFWQA